MSGSNNQGFPQWGKITNPDGSPTQTFLRFMVSLWTKAGSGFIATVNAAYLQQAQTGAGAPVEIRKSSDGSLIGTIPIVNSGGAPPVPVPLGASPLVFKATGDGTLVVESGKVELSRDLGGTWYQISLTGGACPVLVKDWVRVSWYAGPPLVTFFPIGA